MALILTAWECDWHTACGWALRLALWPCPSLHVCHPLQHAVYMFTYSIWNDMLWRSCTKCCETLRACYESRQSCIYTLYIYIFFSVFPFLFCSDYPDMWKGLWGKRSFSNTNTSTYTLLGRCRSMSKQDYDLCMSHQSDSLKGHVGSVHTRQRVTFNWAAADREGRPLTSHAPSFVNQLHTHIHTLIPCPLFTRHYFSSLPLYLPHLYLFFCCFLVPNSSLRW